MKKNHDIQLPTWLDKIIFDEFEAVYEPRPQDVVYNPDQPYDFVKLYLGTYFPRSYAESYDIATDLFKNENYKFAIHNLEEVNILDFCCGTGGEIIGLLVALGETFPNLRRVFIDAYDANPDAIRFLYHLTEAIDTASEFKFEFHVNPQCLYINSEQEIQDIVNLSNVQYHFIMSFKAINEFIQHKTFKNSNPYELITSYFAPLLDNDGVFIISDVTTKSDNGLFYPQIMNNGINKFLKTSLQYKSIIPKACFHHEEQCSCCYMQDVFNLSHSRRTNDISKVAYRIICTKSFAQKIMGGDAPRECRATNPNADKYLPYNI